MTSLYHILHTPATQHILRNLFPGCRFVDISLHTALTHAISCPHDNKLALILQHIDYNGWSHLQEYAVWIKNISGGDETNVPLLEFLLHHKDKLHKEHEQGIDIYYTSIRVNCLRIVDVLFKYKTCWTSVNHLYSLTLSKYIFSTSKPQEYLRLIIKHALADPYFEWNIPHTEEELMDVVSWQVGTRLVHSIPITTRMLNYIHNEDLGMVKFILITLQVRFLDAQYMVEPLMHELLSKPLTLIRVKIFKRLTYCVFEMKIYLRWTLWLINHPELPHIDEKEIYPLTEYEARRILRCLVSCGLQNVDTDRLTILLAHPRAASELDVLYTEQTEETASNIRQIQSYAPIKPVL